MKRTFIQTLVQTALLVLGVQSLQAANLQVLHLEGATIFSREQQQSIAERFIGRPMSFTLIESIRLDLNARYLEQGYFNSGVVLLPEKVTPTGVCFRALVGRLDRIDIENNQWYDETYLRQQLLPRISTPAKLSNLQEVILTLHNDPLIQKVEGQLLPGEEMGSAVLRLSLHEAPPRQISVEINNQSPTSIGETRGVVRYQHLNLSGRADALSLGLGASEGEQDVSISYRYPWFRHSLTLELGVQQSEVVEKPLSELEIESESTNGVLNYGYRLGKTDSLQLRYEFNRHELTLLQQPFPSANNGIVEYQEFSVAWERLNRGALPYQLRLQLGIVEPTSQLEVGSGAQACNGCGYLWASQHHYFPLNQQHALRVRHLLQYSEHELPANRRLKIGGLSTLRGFPENGLSADTALVGSVQYEYALSMTASFSLTLLGFVDYASIQERHETQIRQSHALASAGVGILYSDQRFEGGVHLSRRVEEDGANIPDQGLQGDGGHIYLRYLHQF